MRLGAPSVRCRSVLSPITITRRCGTPDDGSDGGSKLDCRDNLGGEPLRLRLMGRAAGWRDTRVPFLSRQSNLFLIEHM